MIWGYPEFRNPPDPPRFDCCYGPQIDYRIRRLNMVVLKNHGSWQHFTASKTDPGIPWKAPHMWPLGQDFGHAFCGVLHLAVLLAVGALSVQPTSQWSLDCAGLPRSATWPQLGWLRPARQWWFGGKSRSSSQTWKVEEDFVVKINWAIGRTSDIGRHTHHWPFGA